MTTVQSSTADPVSKLDRVDKRAPIAKQVSDLPPELIDRIISWLDTELGFSLPSDPHQRKSTWLYSSPCHLKNLSLACHSLHDMIIPRLFRFMRLKVNDPKDIEGRGIREEVIKNFAALITKYDLHKKVHSVTIHFEPEKPVLGRRTCGHPLLFSSVVCSKVLSTFYPETPTVLAPLSILPYLTSEQWWAPAEENWDFVGPYHVLHNAHMAKEQAAAVPRQAQVIQGSLSLEEISKLSLTPNAEHWGWAPVDEKGYWFDMSIERFACQLRQGWATNLRKFTYIAMFPTVDHIRLVYDELGRLKNLESLTVQFTPTEESDMLTNIAHTGKCPVSEVWLDVLGCLEMTLSFVSNSDGAYRHRNLSTLTFLDWYRYGIAMMLAHACQDYLRGFAFERGSWRKED